METVDHGGVPALVTAMVARQHTLIYHGCRRVDVLLPGLLSSKVFRRREIGNCARIHRLVGQRIRQRQLTVILASSSRRAVVKLAVQRLGVGAGEVVGVVSMAAESARRHLAGFQGPVAGTLLVVLVVVVRILHLQNHHEAHAFIHRHVAVDLPDNVAHHLCGLVIACAAASKQAPEHIGPLHFLAAVQILQFLVLRYGEIGGSVRIRLVIRVGGIVGLQIRAVNVHRQILFGYFRMALVNDKVSVFILNGFSGRVEVVSILVHHLRLTQLEILRHKGPSGDSGSLRRVKAQHRVVPGYALAHLPAGRGMYVPVVDSRHIVGDTVARHQMFHIHCLIGFVDVGIGICLVKVIAVVAHAQWTVVHAVSVGRIRCQVRHVNHRARRVGGGRHQVLVRQAVHRQVDLGRPVGKAHLLIVIHILEALHVDSVSGIRVRNAGNIGCVQAQVNLVGHDLRQHQRIGVHGGTAVQIPRPFLGIHVLLRRSLIVLVSAVHKNPLEQ